MKKQFFNVKTFVFIFLIIAVLMVASALIELHQSKKELLDLMRTQAHTLLETTIKASQNTLLTNQYLEEFLAERLLNNANFIKYLYEQNKITDTFLANFSEQNEIYRINIWKTGGKLLFSSHQRLHFDIPEKQSPLQILAPIFSGTQDTLIIGLKEARYESGMRYAVAVAAKNRSAIVLNLDADDLLQFRKQIGFGKLLQNISANPEIVYIALQDTSGILAASANVEELDRIEQSDFLYQALVDSLFDTREIEYNGKPVYEAVHSFYFQGNSIGLFRVGFSLKALQAINSRIYRRIAIITVILVFIGFVLFTLLIVRQNLDLVQKQYQVVETYSSNIIHSVSDAIVVVNAQMQIKLFNEAAKELFQTNHKKVINEPFSTLFDEQECTALMQSQAKMEEVTCTIQTMRKYLLISKSQFYNENHEFNTAFIIRDLTQLKQMEAQIQRKERLSAMGELASGVAHEIRNPLNTIGTIVQQLDKDFEPAQENDEYHKLAKIVYQEVRRINETIQDFLRFSRPEPIRPEPFLLHDLLGELQHQYQAMFAEKQINFNLRLEWQEEVRWDRRQMKQVFMNLIQNAIDALQIGGKIDFFVSKIAGDQLEIRVRDTGQGISHTEKKKVFNLYFTTKARGTGIGLSIVQRIIYEHGGLISVESEPGNGTTFIMQMPIIVNSTTQ